MIHKPKLGPQEGCKPIPGPQMGLNFQHRTILKNSIKISLPRSKKSDIIKQSSCESVDSIMYKRWPQFKSKTQGAV